MKMPRGKKRDKVKSASLQAAPILEKLSLYSFQRKAVEQMRIYISAYRGSDKEIFGKTTGSGLVHMPTGSGKTAVVAALSRCIPEVGSVLVLCPRVVLRAQLINEVGGTIFGKLGVSPGSIPKSVHLLSDVEKDRRLLTGSSDGAVIIGTIQKLHTMRVNHKRSFSRLVNRVDLVLFDEGHYEPALRWRDTVRSIGKPRVIFTATPFRNDLKLFDVDLDHTYTYSFKKAVSKLMIRDVNILGVRTPRSPEAFVEKVIEFYKPLFGPIPRAADPLDDRPRVIVRCDDYEEITVIAGTFRKKKIACVGIHEKFKDKEADRMLLRHVPDPQKTDAVVWIHQHKLTEGVDDWRFQLLTFYGKAPASVRQMVQQVGRIIRNPRKERNSIGYVLDTFEGELKKQWSSYLKHDELIDREGLKVLNTNEVRFRALQEADPPTLYIDRRFRNPLSPETFKPDEDIQIPLKTNVFYRETGFSMSKVAKAIRHEFEEQDRVVYDPDVQKDRCVILSIRFRNSPYLVGKFYLEEKVCVTVVRLAGRYVCFFDSGNWIPTDLPGFGATVSEEELRRMLEGRETSRIRRVSLINSSVAPDCIHSRSLATYSSMERTPPGFDDHVFMYSTAEGCIDSDPVKHEYGKRRYVGFVHARVAEGTAAKYHSLWGYHRWLERVAEVLARPKKAAIPGLARYAPVLAPPDKTAARSVVLDVSRLRDLYLTTAKAGEPGEPIDVIQEDTTVKDGKFQVVANGQSCSVGVEYDENLQRYVLTSPELAECYYAEPGEPGIVQRLNADQAFRVVPKAGGIAYAAGSFHDPAIGLGPRYKEKHAHVLGAMHSLSVLNGIQSEKGTESTLPNGAGWEKNSLFGLVDRVGGDRLGKVRLTEAENQFQHYFQSVELLVCDDVGTELADFVMVATLPPGRKYVVFIHCKAHSRKTGTKVSASALADVCSQGVKNVGELSLFDPTTQNRAEKWAGAWKVGQLGKVKKRDGHVVNKRIRRGPPDGTQAWDIFRAAVRDPSTVREVWLLTGNMLSKREFKTRLGGGKRFDLETMQALYELFSTQTAIRSRDMYLRIFCNP
jgi:superfamily II DNA or RNA helicase